MQVRVGLHHRQSCLNQHGDHDDQQVVRCDHDLLVLHLWHISEDLRRNLKSIQVIVPRQLFETSLGAGIVAVVAMNLLLDGLLD